MIEIKNRFTGAVIFKYDGANLSGANLSGANLFVANLSGANLSGANLSRANLSGANLSDANLSRANLSRANLSRANLSDANLSDANLSDAYLSRANLSGAYLSGANLSDADLSRATGLSEIARARLNILADGDLIGWKKCDGGVIVKLLIPASAKRSNATGRKCRAEYADVLEVIGDDVGRTDRTSQGGSRIEYRAGERVVPDSWDDDWRNECSHGIHFYITRAEAEAN